MTNTSIASTSHPTTSLSCCQSKDSIENSSIDEIQSVDDDRNQIDNNNVVYNVNDCDTTENIFPKRESVDIEFSQLTYTVKKFSFSKRKFENKEIIHGINGAFRAGELTAIMGPSGAGKSTLLNILAGYVCTGVSGSVSVNGKNRSHNSQKFRNLSCYIHQDDVLRPFLTVSEYMMCAAHLKLGFSVSKSEKLKLIKHILFLLGLDKRCNTFTARLSGGQKKRLAVALEMISNPPIIFLDEPTTGLDSSSCSQCISLLKRLAQVDGRTIVLTIHQPSALIFEMFDKLYAVSRGHCIYQGPCKELVPFLGNLGLPCPSYHNPADFLMDIAVGEYGADVNKIVNAALKKYYEDIGNYVSSRPISNVEQSHAMNEMSVKALQKGGELYEFPTMHQFQIIDDDTNHSCDSEETTTSSIYKQQNKSASLLMQFFLLYHRNLLCAKRNYLFLTIRLLAHILIALLFGYLYQNVGRNANSVLANYVYLYGTILLIVYTGKMAVMLSFPLEMEMLTREHFNRWYKLGPYFLSIISFEVPFQIVCAFLYIICSYTLTGNFVSNTRFYYFVVMAIMASLSAQSWGFFIGATLPVKLAVFIGPILACLYSIFGFCTRYVDITPLFRWMYHISYFRAGFHGVLNTAYGMNRTDLMCPEDQVYCHFRNPKIFLREMDIENVNMNDNLILMTSVIAIMHILTVFTLWYKLNKR